MTARRALAFASTLLVVLLAGGGAQAAGVGTIELKPEHGTSFHVRGGDKGQTTQRMTLHNVGKQTVDARLYAASATRVNDAWSIGGAGSASWIDLADQTVRLTAGETRAVSFVVHRSEKKKTGAVVLEQSAGTVVQRAATLVYLEPGKRINLPLAAVIACAVVIIMGAAVISARSQERIPPEFRDDDVDA